MATRKSAAPSKTTSKPAGKAKASPATRPTGKRADVDWDAIERDYRTDKFTLRELAAKYGVSHQAIQKRATVKGWTKDLAKAIKHATSVKLTQQLVEQQSDKGSQEVAEVVAIAAELNKQVILGHRKHLSVATAVGVNLLQELTDCGLLLKERELLAQILAGEDAEPVDVAQAQAAIAKALGIGNRGKTWKAIVDGLVNLQNAERVAFGLDEKDGDKDKDPVAQSVADFLAGIHGAATGRLTFAPARKA